MPSILYDHQEEAVSKLNNGSILRGGVGTGKSRTAIAYFLKHECLCDYNKRRRPKVIKDLYIITTARKRDSLEWDAECAAFSLSKYEKKRNHGIGITVDSWNNIKKYTDVKNAFFIFDEQRLIGSGAWVKTFYKIARNNNWILLSATPGDNWMDYIPVFVANGFYRNRSQFIREHVVYKNFTKFPKIDHFVATGVLNKYKRKITVNMYYQKRTRRQDLTIQTKYDKIKFDIIKKQRWNIYDDKPIKDIQQLYYLMRKLVNSSPDRINWVYKLFVRHKKIIVFYNFNYELDLLRQLCNTRNIPYQEWNGHNHEQVPTSTEWIYLVQYTAGAEAWNCITTNVIVFYSINYSYKIIEQASGRIDRLNTPYTDLFYYHLSSHSWIDREIGKSVKNKKIFHEKDI